MLTKACKAHIFFPKGNTFERVNLDTSPVLSALSAGSLPDVRPNYTYFSYLMEQSSTVSIQLKTCWVFQTRSRTPGLFSTNTQPYEHCSALWHVDSESIRNTMKHWDTSCLALRGLLKLPEPQHESELTIIQVEVTLDLYNPFFRTLLDIDGIVEMSIVQPPLQDHQWKCITRLARHFDSSQAPEHADAILEHVEVVNVQTAQHSGDERYIRIPFPASIWANTLPNSDIGQAQPLKWTDGSTHELLPQLGSFQELWSRPTSKECLRDSCWVRRALVFWKFQDVRQCDGKGRKSHTVALGTRWKFLTINDPTSEYHLRNAYSYPASEELTSEGAMTTGTDMGIPPQHIPELPIPCEEYTCLCHNTSGYTDFLADLMMEYR